MLLKDTLPEETRQRVVHGFTAAFRFAHARRVWSRQTLRKRLVDCVRHAAVPGVCRGFLSYTHDVTPNLRFPTHPELDGYFDSQTMCYILVND